MRRTKPSRPDAELPVISVQAFNLAGEVGDDPERIERERRDAERRQQEARELEAKMQRTLAECPGFVGCDAGSVQGRVIVEPGRVTEAMQWLKRRFHVSENLELSSDNGLAIDVQSRTRTCKSGGRSRRVSFVKVEQFELAL